MSGGASAIVVESVSKRYVKYDDAPTLVGRTMRAAKRSRRSQLWALRDIDLQVERGTCIGVIGRNGSGKSTLLRMMAGVTAPTKGRVTVSGRVAPLISVGVGFHPELTGRENVFINGMVLGMTRRQVQERFDEILDFAEIEEFIDTPVKFYSSGMFVRLGFAVAVAASPEVLLIDEVLAVGDLSFQMKCFDRMQEIRESGTTIVVVSHNLNAVRRLCEHTGVLHHGHLEQYSDTPSAIALFHQLMDEPREHEDGVEAPTQPGGFSTEITDLRIEGPDPARPAYVRAGQPVAFEVDVQSPVPVQGARLGLHVLHEGGVRVYSEHFLIDRPLGGPTGECLRLVAEAHLPTGSYSAQAVLLDVDRQQISVPAERAFFVDGRPTVQGLSDLRAVLQDPGRS